MRVISPVLFLISLYFTAPLASLAQQGYRPGYIILPSNDTIFGFLKEQSSRKASQSALFKKEIKGATEVFTPDQIKAYRYTESKYYISLLARVDSVQKQVFMEYLIKGKANVYYFKDRNAEHYYIQKEGGELIELTEPQRYTKINDVRYAVAPKYKNKLNFILSDADVTSTIERTSLEYKSLISLAKEYHEKVCDSEACVVYTKKKEETITTYSVFAGYTNVQYNFGSNLITDYEGGWQAGITASFKGIFLSNQRLGFTIGAFLEKDYSTTLRPYRDNDDNYYRVDYKGKRYNIRSNASNSSNYPSELDVDLNVTALRIPITINYYHPVKRSTFTVGLGVSNRITLGRNEDFEIRTFEDEYNRTIQTYFLGGSAVLGYEAWISSSNKITFNVAGDYVTDITAVNQLYRLSIMQFTVRIGFTF